MKPRRLALAELPTPLERYERLSHAWGGPTIWIKRDDLAGFGLTGNKVRKLEFHLAAARDAGATTVVTCGGAQSNHCRATAVAAARLGLRAVLFLRTEDGTAPLPADGNYLLDLLTGADCRYITPGEYDEREALLADAASSIGDAWVIPEGASDHLGMWGFVEAMAELSDQVESVDEPITAIWHAASSGGTTAGMVRGSAESGLELPVVACSIDHPVAELRRRVDEILGEAEQRYGAVGSPSRPTITDAYVGGGYGVASDDELQTMLEATRLTGLFFDPTYTGKALFGLRREIASGRYGPGESVVFWHTGGGFAVHSARWRERLAP